MQMIPVNCNYCVSWRQNVTSVFLVRSTQCCVCTPHSLGVICKPSCCLSVIASEREAGDSRGGSGADVHRLPARRLWLPEERRRDAEGASVSREVRVGVTQVRPEINHTDLGNLMTSA